MTLVVSLHIWMFKIKISLVISFHLDVVFNLVAQEIDTKREKTLIVLNNQSL